MIQANELRIGNLVKYSEDGSLCEVLAVDKMGLSVNVIRNQEITWIELDQFEAIPLTGVILNKCGYPYPIVSDGVPQAFSTKHLDNWMWVLNRDSESWFFTFLHEMENPIIRVYHLHQLQNSYYLLTGEELNCENI